MTAKTDKKVALITGGATGIGKETAFKLAAAGVHIVIAGRHQARGSAVAAELMRTGARAIFVRADVAVETQVKNLIAQTLSFFGRLDYLFNNAGTEGTLGSLENMTENMMDEVLGTNVKGVLLCTKYALPVMVKQGGGTIINTASFVGTTLPLPAAVLYGASKAAVLSVTRAVAAACTGQHIDVFAVCPWVTDTPMADRLAGQNATAKARFGASFNPSGKIAAAGDIADVVFSLFTSRQLLRSGEAILVDHGGLIKKILPMSIEPHPFAPLHGSTS